MPPTTINAAAKITMHSTPSCEFFISNSSEGLFAVNAGTDRLNGNRSKLAAASSSTPVSTPANSAGRSAICKPSCNTPMAVNPSRLPMMLPRPPKIDVPPNTTAVIANNSYPVPASALAWPKWATYIIAARAEQKLHSTYTRAMRFSTGMPAWRAPCGAKPIAHSSRPIVVRCNRIQKPTNATMKIGSCTGIGPRYPWPSRRNDHGKFVKLSVPPVIPSAMPRKRLNDPSVTIKGGIRSRVMSRALSAPASTPTPSAPAAASGIGKWASRHILPKSTAVNPMSEPTDRSMPPVTITGVIARASNPNSTFSRTRL